MGIKIINTKDFDFFNSTIEEAIDNFKFLPKPLDWLEPSINMPYLESCISYVFGQYFSAILTMGVLLEHILRMVVIDPVNCGVSRKISKKKIEKYSSIRNILNDNSIQTLLDKLLENNDNRKWWNDIASVLRNKTAHMIFQDLLKKFGGKDYHNEYFLDSIDMKPPGQWGYVWHRFGKKVATKFIKESTEQIKIIIRNTNWKPDLSWWVSQKYHYESFFNFTWDLNNILKSIKILL